jgi:hypothetical protein
MAFSNKCFSKNAIFSGFLRVLAWQIIFAKRPGVIFDEESNALTLDL